MSVSTQIPWAPGAKYTHITCRLGLPQVDGDDVDLIPDLMGQSGKITLKCDVPRVRYAEADGGNRMLSMNEMSFEIRASDGELVNTVTGEVGVSILSGLSTGVDPANFTWTALVEPEKGKPWRATIPAIEGPYDVTLGTDIFGPGGVSSLDAAITALTARVEALETSGGTADLTAELTAFETEMGA